MRVPNAPTRLFGPYLGEERAKPYFVFNEGTKAVYKTVQEVLIPCTVREITVDNDEFPQSGMLRIEITKTTGPWKKGEVCSAPMLWVRPTACLGKRKYITYLAYPYCWRPKENSNDQK